MSVLIWIGGLSALPPTAAREQTFRDRRFGPRLCEKSKTLDRDRTSYSFKAAFGAYTASPFNFEIEPENIILVGLRLFEFPHGWAKSGLMRCSKERHYSIPSSAIATILTGLQF
jgi:hypothetical protein